MRIDLSFNRPGWLYKLDYKRLILTAFLLRLIVASAYDIFVSMTDNDILLPDSKFYSLNGRYIAALLNGYDANSFTRKMVSMSKDKTSQAIFSDTLEKWKGHFPVEWSENIIYFYIVGFIYFIFGYFPLGARVFNIMLSIASAYFLFKVAKRHFGDLTANIFLIVALFLPTQFGYSLTLSRDFIRAFLVYFILWVIYG